MCSTFDEIAFKPKLNYNQTFDYIENYEGLGFIGVKNEVANTALVFYIYISITGQCLYAILHQRGQLREKYWHK